jgi:NADP-dependent 3-hydroxy acid dehydrogenase YdfG
MRLDLTEHGIKITNIAPGAVETEFSEVRFKGDKEKEKKVYEGFDALQLEDIVGIIVYEVNAPERVTIGDVVVYAKSQSAPTTIFRK